MIFIDGGYLRKNLCDSFGDDNIDFGELLDILLNWYNSLPSYLFQANLIRAYYYDAIVSEEDKEFAKQKEYFKSVTNPFSFTVRLGRLVRSSKKKFKQKGVDILMAIDALSKAYENHYDTAIFVLGDRDFLPLVEAVKDAGKKTIGVFWISNVASELLAAFDYRIVPDEESLERCYKKKK